MAVNILKNVHTNLRLTEEAALPDASESSKGQVVFHNSNVYVYTEEGGVLAWMPLVNQRKSYVHVQGADSNKWIVSHALNTPYLMWSAYDADGNIMLVNNDTVDDNTFEINFNTPQKGHVVVYGDISLDSLHSAVRDYTDNSVIAAKQTMEAYTDQAISDLKVFRSEQTETSGDTTVIFELG